MKLKQKEQSEQIQQKPLQQFNPQVISNQDRNIKQEIPLQNKKQQHSQSPQKISSNSLHVNSQKGLYISENLVQQLPENKLIKAKSSTKTDPKEIKSQKQRNSLQQNFAKQAKSPKQNQNQKNTPFKNTSKSNDGRNPERQSYYNNSAQSNDELMRQQFILLTQTKNRLNPEEKSKLIDELTSPKYSKIKQDFLQMNSQGQQVLIDRLLSSSEAQYEEKKALIEYYMQEELRECTFQPKVSNSNEQDRRSFNQFLDDQQAFKEQNQQRKLQLLQEKEGIQSEQHQNHPIISEKSKAIIEGKRNSGVSVHERLYQEGLLLKQQKLEQANLFAEENDIFLTKEQRQTIRLSQDEEATFKPQIQEKSQKIQRNQKIEDILYQDAIRRLSKVDQTNEKQKTSENKLSLNSQVLLARKLLKELYVVLQQIIPNAEQQREISYEKTAEIMQAMGYLLNFTKEENALSYQEKTLLYDMWLVLRGEEQNSISRRNLIVFLFGILNLSFDLHIDNDQALEETVQKENQKQPKTKIFDDLFFNTIYYQLGNATEQGSKQLVGVAEDNQNNKEIIGEDQFGNKVKVSLGQFDVLGNIYLSESDVKKIQKVYDTFYINKLNSEKNKKNIFRNNRQQESSPTFKPEILEISKNLAANYRYKLIEGAQQMLKDPNGNTYNFQQQLSHADLLVIQKKAQVLAHDQARTEQEQAILEECTFKPQTLQYVNISKKQRKDEQEIIEEAEFESKISNFKKNAMPPQSLGKHRAFELYSLSKPSSQKRDRDPNEIEYEKNCDECTFTPDLTVTKNKKNNGSSVEVIAKSVDKTIERLKKGREMREYVKYIKDKGFTQTGDFTDFQQNKSKYQQQSKNASLNQSIKYPKTKLNQNRQRNKKVKQTSIVEQNYQDYDIQQKQNIQTNQENQGRYDKDQYIYEHNENNQEQEQYKDQISQKVNENDFDNSGENIEKQHTEENEEDIEDRAPLLFVDVNLGIDKAERIVVYEGDSADELAENFGNLHNLDEEMKRRLKDLLNTQINSLLQRIDEEAVSHQSEDDYLNKYNEENEENEDNEDNEENE